MDKPLIIGLTGGIASGKSGVAQELHRLGALVINADQEAKRAVLPGSIGLKRIKETFGPGVILPDGNLNRKKLAELIFSDPQKRACLEQILHPEILRRINDQLDLAVKSKRWSVIVLDIPLLFETEGFLPLVDKVVVVYVPLPIQLERLKTRDGLTEEKAMKRIDSQIPLEEKCLKADYVIDNSGSAEQTHKQILALWKEWQMICESH
jgi:dephospho-CoA kinase